ncbi:PPR_1 domain-containing protein/PPR_2 domain-containing protein [Cephalotus follicularis]|uniref:PPR_1 domain-containing protein/PPR_2 domain-containing protein n=1 Tax=Cephalotus follicularis TaxID=3775 RepID=A0A1Q3DC99_CEPFO|nr:PPR_1 domain-containing protein/PPR_2 domain-containing protein [Cephalotus follicularis]
MATRRGTSNAVAAHPAKRFGGNIFTISTNSLLSVSSSSSTFSTATGNSSDRIRNTHLDKNIDEAIASFNRMLRMHPRPSVVQFGLGLSSIVKFKQYATVVGLCKLMESLGIKHNVYTLNILINCFCRLSLLHFGFSILGKMLKLGVEPDSVTFNTLINGLCIEGKVLQAVRLSDQMAERGCKPDVFTYTIFIDGIETITI